MQVLSDTGRSSLQQEEVQPMYPKVPHPNRRDGRRQAGRPKAPAQDVQEDEEGTAGAVPLLWGNGANQSPSFIDPSWVRKGVQ